MTRPISSARLISVGSSWACARRSTIERSGMSSITCDVAAATCRSVEARSEVGTEIAPMLIAAARRPTTVLTSRTTASRRPPRAVLLATHRAAGRQKSMSSAALSVSARYVQRATGRARRQMRPADRLTRAPRACPATASAVMAITVSPALGASPLPESRGDGKRPGNRCGPGNQRSSAHRRCIDRPWRAPHGQSRPGSASASHATESARGGRAGDGVAIARRPQQEQRARRSDTFLAWARSARGSAAPRQPLLRHGDHRR